MEVLAALYAMYRHPHPSAGFLQYSMQCGHNNLNLKKFVSFIYVPLHNMHTSTNHYSFFCLFLLGINTTSSNLRIRFA